MVECVELREWRELFAGRRVGVGVRKLSPFKTLSRCFLTEAEEGATCESIGAKQSQPEDEEGTARGLTSYPC